MYIHIYILRRIYFRNIKVILEINFFFFLLFYLCTKRNWNFFELELNNLWDIGSKEVKYQKVFHVLFFHDLYFLPSFVIYVLIIILARNYACSFVVNGNSWTIRKVVKNDSLKLLTWNIWYSTIILIINGLKIIKKTIIQRIY